MVDRVDLNRLKSPSILLILGTVGLILFGISFIVEIRVILEYPAYGEVTNVIRGLWSLILGVATIGSFALAAHSYRRDDDSSGPPTNFSVRGRNHDIDFHVHIGDPDESHDPAQRPEEVETDDVESRPDTAAESEESDDSDGRQGDT